MKIDNNFLPNNFITPLTSQANTISNNTTMFSDLLSSLSNKEYSLDEMKTEYLNGERDDIENILIEGQKFNLQVNFALQVRNNMVDMFKQLSTMQI